MKRFQRSVALLLASSAVVSFCLYSKASGPIGATPAVAPMPVSVPQKIEIDLSKALPVKVPTPKFDLKATLFQTPDKKQGWAIKLPGGRPIATPAYWNGMLFVGGGYGSHEFYAFDATTGHLVWKYQTGDDGPTAAVVEDGYCAFNTESCTVYVLNAKSGKLVWQQWLGDPLMSQPAIWDGRLYMAYPGGQLNQHHGAHSPASPTVPGHRMLCADLKTGKHIWDRAITADVISAPVLHQGKVYFTCQDGTSFCFDATKGDRIFKKADASTSAPLIADGKVVVSQKERRGKDTYERLAVTFGKSTTIMRDMRAAYLASAPVTAIDAAMPALPAAVPGLSKSYEMAQDASVGFATAPVSAGLSGVQKNIPLKSVVAGWAYQGSRAAFNGGKKLIVNAQGSTINAIANPDAKNKVNWTAQAKGGGIDQSSEVFSPPALGKENIYLVSGQGHMLSLDQTNGKLRFAYSISEPMMFQPALANGNVYVGTANGMLICLKTGYTDASGWSGWGGNAQHNKD